MSSSVFLAWMLRRVVVLTVFLLSYLNHVLYHCVSLFTISSVNVFIVTIYRKNGVLTPVYKSGDKSSVKNYRPISLLCILSKVLVRLIFDRIYPHIAAGICCNQFGFMKQRSTLQQLLVHLDSIFSLVAQSKQVSYTLTLKKHLTLWITMYYWRDYGIVVFVEKCGT